MENIQFQINILILLISALMLCIAYCIKQIKIMKKDKIIIDASFELVTVALTLQKASIESSKKDIKNLAHVSEKCNDNMNKLIKIMQDRE